MPTKYEFTVNGQQRTVDTEGDRPLLEVLREDLELTGTKYGCGEGECRACTVLLDGEPTASCITPVSSAAGKKLRTIESLSDGDKLHPVQQAFLDADAMQCGYCTPGMIMTATALLERNPHPTEEQIMSGMNGNLCRCCGYSSIVEAVQLAAGSQTEATDAV